ncbi:cysteine-rich secretory protein LCCL domain-containing 1-like [Harmonia axyridis]|uniref:cysteine-rich secretory protein LCCL domain-containing 1-like n=1 Tax=Harmonia axyridis TaxID=115357 RepID=UPI001E276B0D|nr:cysteine-rich secretory protein LCCL domain-containing 1-like [Harmonia axyridis]
MRLPIVLFIFLRISNSFNVDYCKLPCHTNNGTVEHVMCTLKHDCSVGPECKVKTRFEYTSELKSFTLDMHNYYRNRVSFGDAFGQDKGNLPQASDMLEMVWDEELAHFAQCYANKCILQYDKCRQSSAGEKIGQLIFIKMMVNPKSVEEIITQMLESLFNTSESMSLEDVENYKDNRYTRHFAQLVWAKTNRVGCGITKLLEDIYAFFMVCNYGPAGNVEGDRIYSVGSTCTNCPGGRKCGTKYTGLCAATEKEKRSSMQKIESLKTLEQIITLEDDEESFSLRALDSYSSNSTVQADQKTWPTQDSFKDTSQETAPSTGGMAEATSESFEPPELSYEEVTTDDDAEIINDLSINERKALVTFEKLVEITTAKQMIVKDEVPLKLCTVKRRPNWPDISNQDNGSQTELRQLRFGILCLSCLLVVSVSR